MAPPRASGPRRSQLPNEHIYTLGERGRKTGVMLRDTGVRDEHGMEPLDSVFSSPAKSPEADAQESEEGAISEETGDDNNNDDDDDDDEVDMDLTTVAGPGPAALLNGQSAAARLAIRQGRSPPRSLFGSPAVRAASSKRGGSDGHRPGALRENQLLRPPSSPDEAASPNSSPTKPVERRLDYSRATAIKKARKPVLLPASAARHTPSEDEEDDTAHDESMQMIGSPDEREPESEPELEPEEVLTTEDTVADKEEKEDEALSPVPKKRRGRPPGKAVAAKEKEKGAVEPAANGTSANGTKRRRGRLSTSSVAEPVVADEAETEEASAKRPRVEPKPRGRPRGRPAASKPVEEVVEEEVVEEEEGEEEGEEEEESEDKEHLEEKSPESKPGKGKGKRAAKEAEPAEEPPRKRRGRKSSGVGAATAAAAAVPRAPPLPRSRGLVIRRRADEGVDVGAMRQTRSGRTSYQPLAFWRNEHAEFDASETQDAPWKHGRGGAASHADRRFVLPAIREIYRVEDEELPPFTAAMGRRRGGGGGGGSSRRKGKKKRDSDDDQDDENGDERQAWEYDPGRVQGAVAVWRPEHELEPPALGEDVEEADTELAVSALAIQTHDVRDGSFRFAKTLSLPFFGTGIVDLAPGAEKRPKNSRKMHMAFFVHYGHVAVTVNETEFRISKGGTWTVPRGNYYSILNDSDRPARIFFSQGCEILTVLEPAEE